MRLFRTIGGICQSLSPHASLLIHSFKLLQFMHIAIIGAGAAGCFCAIELAQRLTHAVISVYERAGKPLAKVAVTGGGRCNLTNTFEGVRSMESAYPRGARLMKRLLREFSHDDVCRWFEQAGVRLVAQEDHCVFPVSQDAMEIVHTLTRLMRQHGVRLFTHARVTRISHADDGTYSIGMADGSTVQAQCVVVTTGGSPKLSGLDMLQPLSLEVVPPAPSLFSLCLPNHPLCQLMGTVVDEVTASIPGTKFRASGPLLLTHWGLSGPAILRLSSYAARYLQECDYQSRLALNWFGDASEAEVLALLQDLWQRHPQKQLQSVYPPCLNSRLWHCLLELCQQRPAARWSELHPKHLVRLSAMLSHHVLSVSGKNRFKEEFVTCGGVALSNVAPSTLESRRHAGLYFAGEVLDVDAVTGGFNLQAAWTMGYVVAKSIAAARLLP